jgi:hypothetical protein
VDGDLIDDVIVDAFYDVDFSVGWPLTVAVCPPGWPERATCWHG